MRNRRSSGAMLIELIVAVLSFTLCAALLVEIFSAALKNSRLAGAETKALAIAESAADTVYSLSGAQDAVREALTALGFAETDEGYALETEAYTVTVRYSASETFLTGAVTAVSGGETMFTLPLSRYLGGAYGVS